MAWYCHDNIDIDYHDHQHVNEYIDYNQYVDKYIDKHDHNLRVNMGGGSLSPSQEGSTK